MASASRMTPPLITAIDAAIAHLAPRGYLSAREAVDVLLDLGLKAQDEL